MYYVFQLHYLLATFLAKLFIPAVIDELEGVPDVVEEEEMVGLVQFGADKDHLLVMGDEEVHEVLEYSLPFLSAGGD